MPPTDDKKAATNPSTDKATDTTRDLPSKDASSTYDKDENVKGGRMRQDPR